MIGRIFASEIWRAYFREGLLFLGGGGLIIGILRYTHRILYVEQNKGVKYKVVKCDFILLFPHHVLPFPTPSVELALHVMGGATGGYEFPVSHTLYSQFPCLSIVKNCKQLQNLFTISPGSLPLGYPISCPLYSCLL